VQLPVGTVPHRQGVVGATRSVSWLRAASPQTSCGLFYRIGLTANCEGDQSLALGHGALFRNSNVGREAMRSACLIYRPGRYAVIHAFVDPPPLLG
jgi:hypothetical protein